jgi:hypothetical protein
MQVAAAAGRAAAALQAYRGGCGRWLQWSCPNTLVLVLLLLCCCSWVEAE